MRPRPSPTGRQPTAGGLEFGRRGGGLPLLPCPANDGERLESRKLPPPLLACYPWPEVTVISHQ